MLKSIVGQQISSKAQATVWERMLNELQEITPDSVNACSLETLQRFGITFRKAGYIKNTAEKVAPFAVTRPVIGLEKIRL